jgi:hypothetical protein
MRTNIHARRRIRTHDPSNQVAKTHTSEHTATETGQLSYDGGLKKRSFHWTYRVTVKKVENKIMYYKETAECLQLIFWPRSQRRVHYHTAKLKPNQRVTIDWVPLWAACAISCVTLPHELTQVTLLCSPIWVMLLAWLLFIVYAWITLEPVVCVNTSTMITVWAAGTGHAWDLWTQTWDLDVAKSCVPQEECM